MKLKKIMWSIVLIIIVSTSLFVIINAKNINQKFEFNKSGSQSKEIKVVVSNFASYDFLRAVIKDSENVKLEFLLGPGKDSHSFDPTAKDLINIQNADLFVYVGGKMEEWSEKVLDAIDTSKTEIICISDYVEKVKEKKIDGVSENEEEHENDEEGAFEEHIWSSPKNAIQMVEVLGNAMSKIDQANNEKYTKNTQNYIEQIKNVDNKIQKVIDDKVRKRLLFGDRMPMQYFMDYYGLEVSAAFDGCSTDVEPSSQTIAYLIDVAKKNKIPVILYIELNTGKVASTIASEVGDGCIALQIQTLHNVSKDDFNNGETWVSLMERNVDVLKKALQ